MEKLGGRTTHRIIGVTELQRHFRTAVDQVARDNAPFTLKRGSQPEATLIPYEDFLHLQALHERGRAGPL